MASSFAAALIAEMLDDFGSKGTFGEVGNFLTGKDEHFGLGDWWRVVRTVPSLRRYMLLALAWNAIAKPRGWTGYSERYRPGRKYNFSYRSFCTDFLVWESIFRTASHFGLSLPDWVPGRLDAYFGLARSNCYEVEYRRRILPMFSYYPKRDHMVDPESEVHRLFFSRDDNVPDIDTTCIVLGSWISLLGALGLPVSAYAPGGTETGDLLALMAEHIHGEGKYGQGGLSYENGARAGDHGVLTWVFDEHNELDPTSNVNILNYLIQIGRILPAGSDGPAVDLGRRIIRFLANHAEDGTLLNQRFQSYYPLGPSLFFWRRLRINWFALDPSARTRFDPDNAMARIDDFLLAEAERIFASPKRPYNEYDFLTAAPFLYERGAMREFIRKWLGDGRGLAEHFRRNHYEIFHLRYPSKITCAPIRIPFACLIDLLTIVDKTSY
jgi:hypothetical protein